MTFFFPAALRAHRRQVATGTHLIVSAVIALAAFFVFRVWFPAPFDEMAGGLALFALVFSVDVVLGPALTAVVASPRKSKRELRRDLLLIIVFQLAGLVYGLWTLAQARPVALSYEIDRFRLVTAADIDPATLRDAPVAFRELSWQGPRLIAAVKPKDPGELLRSLDLGLAGVDLSMVPKNWRTYESEASAAWRAARPASLLLSHYPASGDAVRAMSSATKRSAEALRFLPVLSRRQSWVALMEAPDARIVGYLPLDGFF